MPLSRKFHLVAGAAILSVLALPTIAVAGDTTKGSCVAEKQAFASSSTSQQTSSNTFTNLVGANLKPSITQGRLGVDFTAEAYASTNGNILFVQLLLDGTPMNLQLHAGRALRLSRVATPGSGFTAGAFLLCLRAQA
jgi:hypothetical protein